jgi:RHH-type proline utilization regulon transcriptional repressor/proline dehydrogenase/delta 1-pyrroline-5-carboxylate dehydrogenase
MIVDSSALTEQVVRDAVTSAFNSAGQRCSALRLLLLPEDTADEVIGMLIGRMREIVIGDPSELATDVGPVIDGETADSLHTYLQEVGDRILYSCSLSRRHGSGSFVPPTLVQLDKIDDLTREIFGPVLHVVRYDPEKIDDVVDTLNRIGYGLTLGIQSRIDSFAEQIVKRCRVGNIYINRDMIGAVVGVQPFGGFGLSGTGPKAGGPKYLLRFGVEQSIATNTAAIGGNATLLGLSEL